MTTLTYAIDIDAPIQTVWGVLTQFDKYESWNTFTPQVETTGRLGDGVTLHVRLNDSGRLTKSNLTIEQIEPYTLCWGDDNLFIKAHRTQTLTQLDDGRTRYESSEPFGGLLAPIIIWLLKSKLMRGYQWAAEGLKKEAEQRSIKQQRTEA